MMGASLLSCSFIFFRLGWVFGVIVFALTVGIDLLLYRYLIDASYHTQMRTYRDLTEQVISRKLSVATDISMYVIYLGALTAYVIISSQIVKNFLKNILQYTANVYAIKAIISFGIIFPLCLLKNLK